MNRRLSRILDYEYFEYIQFWHLLLQYVFEITQHRCKTFMGYNNRLKPTVLQCLKMKPKSRNLQKKSS